MAGPARKLLASAMFAGRRSASSMGAQEADKVFQKCAYPGSGGEVSLKELVMANMSRTDQMSERMEMAVMGTNAFLVGLGAVFLAGGVAAGLAYYQLHGDVTSLQTKMGGVETSLKTLETSLKTLVDRMEPMPLGKRK